MVRGPAITSPPNELSFRIALRPGQQRRRLQRFERSLDRVNSAVLIERARRVFWRYWQQGVMPGSTPCGVVLQGENGKVVFDPPALLPDEEFVPVEWIQGRASVTTGRSARPRTGSETPWSPAQP